ncbi:MAG TPA: hypothetical protein VGF13_02545 [Verrucomicrobiae bacterium]|jgi:hypothetical protein
MKTHASSLVLAIGCAAITAHAIDDFNTAEATTPVLDEGFTAQNAFQVRATFNWRFSNTSAPKIHS